jgi:hypothetical protein
VASELGYCAFDARRRPLTGRELRGCWEQRVGAAAPESPPIVESHRLRVAQRPWPAPPPATADPVMARGFVPIELLGRLPTSPGHPPATGSEAARETPPAYVIPEPDEDWSERTSLFGDGEG